MNKDTITNPIPETEALDIEELQAMYDDAGVDWLHLIAEQDKLADEDEVMIRREDELVRKTAMFWWVFLLCITAAATLICYIHHHLQ